MYSSTHDWAQKVTFLNSVLQERFIHVSWNLMVGYALIQKKLAQSSQLKFTCVYEAPDSRSVPKGKVTT